MLKIRKIIAIVCVFTFTQTNVQSRQEENVNREKILMILRGSINPPTLEHFRIFGKLHSTFLKTQFKKKKQSK